MNAVAPSADRIVPHSLTVRDLHTLFRAGVTFEPERVELVDGALRERGAGGLHRFTVDDMLAMIRAGVIAEGGHVELIEGVLVDMPADGPLHVDWSAILGRWLHRSLPDEYLVVPDSTLRLADDTAPQPDYYVFPTNLETAAVRGPDVLLAIEQSDSSLSRDLNEKALIYASHGVREYWVIDLRAKRLIVHRQPGSNGYESKTTLEREARIDALLIPGLSLRLADLPRVGG